MDEQSVRQNVDFLEIAMEQMETDSVEYEFVAEVYHNLLAELQE